MNYICFVLLVTTAFVNFPVHAGQGQSAECDMDFSDPIDSADLAEFQPDENTAPSDFANQSTDGFSFCDDSGCHNLWCNGDTCGDSIPGPEFSYSIEAEASQVADQDSGNPEANVASFDSPATVPDLSSEGLSGHAWIPPVPSDSGERSGGRFDPSHFGGSNVADRYQLPSHDLNMDLRHDPLKSAKECLNREKSWVSFTRVRTAWYKEDTYLFRNAERSARTAADRYQAQMAELKKKSNALAQEMSRINFGSPQFIEKKDLRQLIEQFPKSGEIFDELGSDLGTADQTSQEIANQIRNGSRPISKPDGMKAPFDIHSGGNPLKFDPSLPRVAQPTFTENRVNKAMDSFCFPAETLVRVKDSSDLGHHPQPIDSIKVGDFVLTCNLHRGGVCEFGEVKALAPSRKVDRLVALTYGKDRMKVRATGNHPFYVVEKNHWVEADELELGNHFLNFEGKEVSLERKVEEQGQFAVFNLTVEGNHNYYACDLLVHNCKVVDQLADKLAAVGLGVSAFASIEMAVAGGGMLTFGSPAAGPALGLAGAAFATKAGCDVYRFNMREGDSAGQTEATQEPKRMYEPNPKHGPSQRGRANPEPRNPQETLDKSVRVSENSSVRVGADKATGEFNVFHQHRPGQFHGHSRAWGELTEAMKSALIKAKITNHRGKIL